MKVLTVLFFCFQYVIASSATNKLKCKDFYLREVFENKNQVVFDASNEVIELPTREPQGSNRVTLFQRGHQLDPESYKLVLSRKSKFFFKSKRSKPDGVSISIVENKYKNAKKVLLSTGFPIVKTKLGPFSAHASFNHGSRKLIFSIRGCYTK